MLAGVTARACVLLYLRARRVLSHITVCGNGALSGKGIVHYHKDNLLQAKVPCLCALPWGVEETLCCLISMHNRQYENPAGSNAGASGLSRHDVQGRNREIYSDSFTKFCSTSFEIIIFLAAVPSCNNCFVI